MSKTKVGTVKVVAPTGLYGGYFAVTVSEDYMNIYASVEPADIGIAGRVKLTTQRKVNGVWNSIESKTGKVSAWHPACYCEDEPFHTQFNNYGKKGTAIRVKIESLDVSAVLKPFATKYITWTR